MKTYKYKLYSNHGNRELHKMIEGHAHVWNHCVALQRRYYAMCGKYISKFRLMRHITTLKRVLGSPIGINCRAKRFKTWRRG